MLWVVLCFCHSVQKNNYLFLPARQSHKWEVISLGFLDSLFKKKVEGKTAEEWYALAVRETDPEKKIEYFDKVLKLKPDFAGVWNLRGLEFVVLKRYEEAIASFDKALEIRPSYPEAKYNKEDAETELRKIKVSEAKTGQRGGKAITEETET
jgi:tetratricopeptide (TPR) repeat protein